MHLTSTIKKEFVWLIWAMTWLQHPVKSIIIMIDDDFRFPKNNIIFIKLKSWLDYNQPFMLSATLNWKIMKVPYTYYFVLLAFSFFYSKSNGQWVQTNGPGGGSVYDYALLDSNIYAATKMGLYRSTVNGSSWTQSGFPGSFVTAVEAADDGSGGMNLFACVLDNGVFVSADSGNSWNPVNTGLPNVDVYCIAVNPNSNGGSDLFIGLLGSGVYRSVNNGNNWTSVGFSGSVYDIAANDSLIFAATGSGVRKSSDGGITWSSSGLSGNMVVAVEIANNGSGGKIIYAGTNGGGVQRSTNYGSTWTSFNSGLSNAYPMNFLVKDSTIYLCLYGTGIFKTTVPNSPWSLVSPVINARTMAYYEGLSSEIFYAGIDDGTGVMRSFNQGATWSNFIDGMIATNTESVTVMHDSTGVDLIFAGTSGEGGKAFKTNNNGGNWIATNITWLDTWAIRSFPHNTSGMILLAGGTDSGTRISADSGTTTSLALSDALHAVVYKPVGNGMYEVFASTGSGVFKTNNSGASWSPFNAGLANLNAQSIIIIDTNLYAATSSGIFKSSLNTASWVASNSGITNNNMLSLAVYDSNMFAGTYGGEIYYSSNSGASWAPTGTWINCNYVKELIFYGTTLFAATDNGIFVTEDFGNSWTTANTGLTTLWINDLAVSDTLLVAATNLGVWIRPLSQMITGLPTVFNDDYISLEIFPNPFQETTNVYYSVRKQGLLEVEIYNVLGKKVQTINKKFHQPGTYKFIWNAKDFDSGIYHMVVKSETTTKSKRILLVK